MAKKAATGRSKAQTAASRKWASAGRAKQSAVRAAYKKSHHGNPPPRTKKQHAASVRAAAAGRAAQAARRQGKPVQSRAKPKAPPPDTWTVQRNLDLPGLVPSETGVSLDLHALPVCGPVAVAEHLAAFTGGFVPDESLLALWELTRDATMDGLLEHVRAEGFPGFPGERLAWFEQCDPDYRGARPGLRAAACRRATTPCSRTRTAQGAVSWGLLVPWCALLHDGAAPAEAWWLEWEAE